MNTTGLPVHGRDHCHQCWTTGWRDAHDQAAAAIDAHTYKGMRSAAHILGCGPDDVIVDGDWVEATERDRATARAAIKAVLKVHRAQAGQCVTCGVGWPCETVQILDDTATPKRRTG